MHRSLLGSVVRLFDPQDDLMWRGLLGIKKKNGRYEFHTMFRFRLVTFYE